MATRTKRVDPAQGSLFQQDQVLKPEETFSHSRLNTFKNCPLNFRFRYVDKLPSEDESLAAFLGSRVHEALEYLYREVTARRLPELEEVLLMFERRWDAEDSDLVVPRRRGMDKEQAKQEGRVQIKNYYGSHHPFQNGRVLLLEGRLKFFLGGPTRISFQAILDRLVRADDGALEVHDYKTGRRLPTQKQLDQDSQLSLYEIAVRDKFKHRGEVRLIWHCLAHQKALSSRRTPDALEKTRVLLGAQVLKVREARAQGHFPPRPGPLCYYCSYRKACIRQYEAQGKFHPVLSG